MTADRLAHGGIECRHVGAGEEALGVIQREGALLGGELGAGRVGGVLDDRHPATGEPRRLRRSVADAGEDERVGQSGNAKADAPLGLRLPALRLERVV